MLIECHAIKISIDMLMRDAEVHLRFLSWQWRKIVSHGDKRFI